MNDCVGEPLCALGFAGRWLFQERRQRLNHDIPTAAGRPWGNGIVAEHGVRQVEGVGRLRLRKPRILS
jgi:hypothetical protein